MLDCLNLIENSQRNKNFLELFKSIFQNVGFQILLVSKYFQNQTYLGLQGFQILNGFLFEKNKTEKTLFAK